jgi:hypothetical protein
MYSDGTPMTYSQASVWGPEDTNIEYLKARTDREGYLAFKPKGPGIWKFQANDGQGHLSEGEITVEALALANPHKPSEGPNPSSQSAPGLKSLPAPKPLARSGGSASPSLVNLLLGLSIIGNLALIFGLWRRKGTKGSQRL